MPQEFELIAEFRRRAGSHPAVELGIGDDAAVLASAGRDSRTLITVDLLAEGTHFRMPPATPRDVARADRNVDWN